jgi:glycolate oxidase iron-sulfur subunit
MKQVLEGAQASAVTQRHLDRCLSCRNCETTCPSGVQYGRLVDIGREVVEEQVARSSLDRFLRTALRRVLPYRGRFTPLLRLGQAVRPIMPPPLKRMVPERLSAGDWPANQHARSMLVLQGCVQPALAPDINAATARVLDRLGIRLLAAQDGCCGAVSHHLSASEEALGFMRRNIDTWWPYVEQGAEAIVMTASGCGAVVKEYGHLLRHDPAYAERAARIAALTRDLSEVLRDEDLGPFRVATPQRVAFHPPCTLQHGQKLQGVVEGMLRDLGYELTAVPDVHLCCGSAGTYSILQPDLGNRLKRNKLEALESGAPEVIATANIGCLTHLQSEAKVPVKHWVELLAAS